MGLVISAPSSNSGSGTSAKRAHTFEAVQDGLLWNDEFDDGEADLALRGYTITDNDWNAYTRVGDVRSLFVVNELSVGQYRSSIVDSHLLIQTPQNAYVGIFISKPVQLGNQFTLSTRQMNTFFPWVAGSMHQVMTVQSEVLSPQKLFEGNQQRIDIGQVSGYVGCNSVKSGAWNGNGNNTMSQPNWCTSFLRVDESAKTFQAQIYVDSTYRYSTAVLSHPALVAARIGFMIRQENLSARGTMSCIDYLRAEPYSKIYGRDV